MREQEKQTAFEESDRRFWRRRRLKTLARAGLMIPLLLAACGSGVREIGTAEPSVNVPGASATFEAPTPDLSPEKIQPMSIDRLQQIWQDSGYQVKDFETGQAVDLTDFQGQKLVILLFASPDEGSSHLNYLSSVRDAEGVFRRIFIYSANANNVSERDKTGVSSKLFGEELYQLAKVQNVEGVQRPGVDSPEIYLVDTNGAVRNSISYGIIRPDNMGIPDGILTSGQLGQLVDKLD